jgi:hypothetical protein
MPAIANSKCGNPLISCINGGEIAFSRLPFVIGPEIGFGSGEPLIEFPALPLRHHRCFCPKCHLANILQLLQQIADMSVLPERPSLIGDWMDRSECHA